MSSYSRHSADGYRERDSYRSRDRDWDRYHDRDRDRDRYRPRNERSQSRSRSPDRSRPRDLDARVKASPRVVTSIPPRDPRVRTKESPYEDATRPRTGSGSPTERIIADIMPGISTETHAASPQSRIASLLRRLIKATAEEEMYKSRVEELEKFRATAKKLATHFRQYPAPADFRDHDSELNGQALRSARASLAAAEKRVKDIPKELADELVKVTSLSTPEAPPTPKVPPDLEARFEALEKAVSQEKSARAEEAKAQELRVAALEEDKKSLEEEVKSLQHKVRASDKMGGGIEDQISELSREQNRQDLQMKSLEKLVKSTQSETHDIKKEVDTQHALLETVQGERTASDAASAGKLADLEQRAQQIKAQLTGLEGRVKQIEAQLAGLEGLEGRAQLMESQLADIDIPGVDEAVNFTENFNAEFTSSRAFSASISEIRENVKKLKEATQGLKAFDDQIVAVYGGWVDQFDKRVKALEGKEPPARDESAQDRQEGPVWSRIEEQEQKLSRLEEALTKNQDTLSAEKASLEQLSSTVDQVKKANESIDLSVKSLDSRWNNMYTKEWAERVIGQLERLYPHSHQINQAIKDMSNRVKKLEARAQMAEQDRGGTTGVEQNNVVFGSTDQNY